eukprot:332993-Ditylum_brightwellii.AAC.1
MSAARYTMLFTEIPSAAWQMKPFHKGKCPTDSAEEVPCIGDDAPHVVQPTDQAFQIIEGCMLCCDHSIQEH